MLAGDVDKRPRRRDLPLTGGRFIREQSELGRRRRAGLDFVGKSVGTRLTERFLASLGYWPQLHDALLSLDYTGFPIVQVNAQGLVEAASHIKGQALSGSPTAGSLVSLVRILCFIIRCAISRAFSRGRRTYSG